MFIEMLKPVYKSSSNIGDTPVTNSRAIRPISLPVLRLA